MTPRCLIGPAVKATKRSNVYKNPFDQINSECFSFSNCAFHCRVFSLSLLSAACEVGRSDITAHNNYYLFTQVSLKCCAERYEPPSAEECDLLLPLSAT